MQIATFKNGTEEKYKNKKAIANVQKVRVDNYAKEIEEALDLIEKYAEEIEPPILDRNKSSVSKTMALILFRNSSQRAQNRKTHQEMVEGLAKIAAKQLGLHVKLTGLIAKNHDIGHMFLGHDGERWLSNVKEELGLGTYVHNSLGPKELMYRYKIYDEIIREIAFLYPEKEAKELNRLKRSLWLILDGINCHNGEMTQSVMRPNTEKTEADFKEEVMKCHTEKGFDRKISPATMEGCLVRMCDIIAYTPCDMIDSLYEGLMDKIDGKHESILLRLGITSEEIAKANARKNYDKIAKKVQIILLKSLMENSTKDEIKLSPEVSDIMYEFRKANQDIIFAEKNKRENVELYSDAIKRLMIYYADMIDENIGVHNLREINKNRFFAKSLMNELGKGVDEEFIRFITGTNSDIYDFNEEMLKKVEENNEEAKKIPFERRMSLEFAAEFLSTLNDHQFIKLAKSKKIITEAQNASIREEYRKKEDEYSL